MRLDELPIFLRFWAPTLAAAVQFFSSFHGANGARACVPSMNPHHVQVVSSSLDKAAVPVVSFILHALLRDNPLHTAPALSICNVLLFFVVGELTTYN